jgi:hypothetical protein
VRALKEPTLVADLGTFSAKARRSDIFLGVHGNTYHFAGSKQRSTPRGGLSRFAVEALATHAMCEFHVCIICIEYPVSLISGDEKGKFAT